MSYPPYSYSPSIYTVDTTYYSPPPIYFPSQPVYYAPPQTIYLTEEMSRPQTTVIEDLQAPPVNNYAVRRRRRRNCTIL